ncbi:hypothetical protein MAPG_09859 [Magnaporthiopsis poae ATCC 64411]|uniref:Uncharacterized protein n=1 Tax=Magnaporthiopsis poae (strain ATCC 64411 / 73-15) TaxID=644358 RepID=A0A0C4EB18_MAGP6|nr:hypothetical protein MAPG_09859 [Magnaporthiopsis poae ATCC 64411]
MDEPDMVATRPLRPPSPPAFRAEDLAGWGGTRRRGGEAEEDDCRSALRGERLPANMRDTLHFTLCKQLCVLKGIRHHPGFGSELRDAALTAGISVLVRALNARAIMSNQIPDMDDRAHVPYCIWYPDVASEETYRALARRYPHMRYQVGRACAVAGYVALYKELDLLPDVSIAEEARDNLARNDGRSQPIFDSIVAQPVRWTIMNDYTRTIREDDPVPAQYGLNGDTAVWSTLGFSRGFLRQSWLDHVDIDTQELSPGWNFLGHALAPHYFNITEDWSIGEVTTRSFNGRSPHQYASAGEELTLLPNNDAMASFLWNPLPRDLPAGNKDVLVLMAAYHGDIDRYTRLRRPVPVSDNEACCIRRGIHHNTGFARWVFQDQPGNDIKPYIRAIHARFIMSNDLSRISADQPPDDQLPWQIWYPTQAAAETYVELARRRPSMRPAVARALIVADYQNEWDDKMDWDFKFTDEMFEQARASPNPHYQADLYARSGEDFPNNPAHTAYIFPVCKNITTFEACIDLQLQSTLSTASVLAMCYHEPEANPGIYNGYGGEEVHADNVELYIATRDELRPPNDGKGDVDLQHLWEEQIRGGFSEEEKESLVDYRGPGRWFWHRRR